MFDRTPTDDLEVRITELLVATPDGADPLLAPQVQEVLALLRERMRMDIAFVTQFQDGKQVVRRIDQAADLAIPEGHADPLEDSWCRRVVDGLLPELLPDAQALVARGELPAWRMPVGTYISTPVVLGDGQVFGTVCCVSRVAQDDIGERELKRLRSTAKLIADKLVARQRAERAQAPLPDWSLQPRFGDTR
jgi:hypothetical protein